MLTHSELISIGHPLTPIAQDASWADHPQEQEEDDLEAQPTPSPKASPALRRLRKGPRPPVSESEAKAAEDIPAASADDTQEEERVPTPPTTDEAVLKENVSVPNPPAHQVEVENLEAATTNTNEATDVVMAEANVEPAPTQELEVSEANDNTASVPAPAAGPQFDCHVEHRPQVQKPIPRLPRFPGPASAPGSFNVNGFKADDTFFNSSKNPYSRE